MSFSFSFSGDDIDEDVSIDTPSVISSTLATSTSDDHTNRKKSNDGRPQAGAFPVEGKPQLPALAHSLDEMMAMLPSKIAYNTLRIALDGGSDVIELPRRELWDVKVQLMAEDDGEGEANATEGLGAHDVKTGVYEGGFKSWESSVDLIKVLASERYGIAGPGKGKAERVIELGCGTALPSLAIFQQALQRFTAAAPDAEPQPLTLIVADYNPSVIQLVTLPNFILTWALARRTVDPALEEAFNIEDEVELFDEVKAAFKKTLSDAKLSLVFLSGGWSTAFVDLLYAAAPLRSDVLNASVVGARESLPTLLLGAETIYSPFALRAFAATQFNILSKEGKEALALIAAKRHYFGVGGSLDDFIAKATDDGATVKWLREEKDGVRRGVVECKTSA
ncbi:Histidine protein methyltransferase 1 [Ceratocystis fimbriata CBS 114723]|uniref:protein-histidine N-methyltransferase n=1 Tax=Ceratocystis fimbriata CBS 114723 TaxID=1035309 RepID=A0A2C5XD88_9PEZI|nr:Histidine protein methyltransferase 1 [Ceratocystis fimbriata CBS 114723]